MRYIIVLMVCVAAIFALPHFAMAQTAAPTTQSYQDVLKLCGAEWRASDERKAVVKGQGQKAWNDYRAKCVKDKGYVTKRGRSAAPQG